MSTLLLEVPAQPSPGTPPCRAACTVSPDVGPGHRPRYHQHENSVPRRLGAACPGPQGCPTDPSPLWGAGLEGGACGCSRAANRRGAR